MSARLHRPCRHTPRARPSTKGAHAGAPLQDRSMRRSEPMRRRSSLRLRGFDYSSAGAYFVTICVQHRLCLLGDVADETIRLNDAGTMVDRWWQELLGPFPMVELDEYVVMPNHIHGILWIQPVVTSDGSAANLSSIIQWFKTIDHQRIHRRRKDPWVGTFPRQAVAATFLRPHHSKRRFLGQGTQIHSGQSASLAIRSGKPVEFRSSGQRVGADLCVRPRSLTSPRRR